MLPVQKVKGFCRLLHDWWTGICLDSPFWGYRSAVRWHFIPIVTQVRHYLGLNPLSNPVELRVSGCEHPIWLRPGTSDYSAYRQIFAEREYASVEVVSEASLILDCGANVGLASVYFLNHFVRARVVAVEPDSENAALCRRNLQKYGARAAVVEGGVWSHGTELVVIPSEFGAGNKWGISVRPRRPEDVGFAVVEAFDIPSLLQRAGAEQIDILKIDIERSELALFSSPTDWLDRVRNLVIELHGDDCLHVFFRALEQYEYELLHRGDLTFCLKLRRACRRFPQDQVGIAAPGSNP
jgi:FkbM family methyltransferase